MNGWTSAQQLERKWRSTRDAPVGATPSFSAFFQLKKSEHARNNCFDLTLWQPSQMAEEPQYLFPRQLPKNVVQLRAVSDIGLPLSKKDSDVRWEDDAFGRNRGEINIFSSSQIQITNRFRQGDTLCSLGSNSNKNKRKSGSALNTVLTDNSTQTNESRPPSNTSHTHQPSLVPKSVSGWKLTKKFGAGTFCILLCFIARQK